MPEIGQRLLSGGMMILVQSRKLECDGRCKNGSNEG